MFNISLFKLMEKSDFIKIDGYRIQDMSLVDGECKCRIAMHPSWYFEDQLVDVDSFGCTVAVLSHAGNKKASIKFMITRPVTQEDFE